jgi:putative nucleotidyltransferase with HDIG domain
VQRSYIKLERILEQTVNSLSSVAELRDPYTAGHQIRVANLAGAIASELGMPVGKIRSIKTAALIHDIGKVYIPAEILSKPGMLNELERSYIQVHVQAGYDIVKTIEFTQPIAEIILQHHEQMNGSGYPRGLSGDSILEEARVLAVADVIEAIASNRPYRPAFTLERALDMIRKNKEILYDPDVVEACLRLFEKGFNFNEF